MKYKRKKAVTGIEIAAIVGAITSLASAGLGVAQANTQAAQKRRQERFDIMSQNEKNSQLFSSNLQSFYNNQDAVEQRKNDLILPTLNNSQFKAGGVRYFNRIPMAKYGCRKIR